MAKAWSSRTCSTAAPASGRSASASSLPIFDGGLRQAQTEQAEAFQREALAAYQGAVRAAFRDVADALANLRAGREQQADVELNERANLSALASAQLRYDSGYSAYLEFLDAQRTSNVARLLTIRNRENQLIATVVLFKALGGGWLPVEEQAQAR